MRSRVPLCTLALVLLLAWLAAVAVSPRGENRYVLEVPATYLSVGQQFQPRLVSLAANAATEPDQVTVQLRSGDGRALQTTQTSVDGAAIVNSVPWSLPRAGSFALRATGPDGVQTITLHAMTEPGVDFGGVRAVAAVGLAEGISDYLQQHSFALGPLPATPTEGARTLVIIGDPRLPGEAAGDLAATYGQVWKLAGEGANVLALEPPPPGVAAFWPEIAPLAPAPATGEGCTQDALATPMSNGINSADGLASLLQPPVVYDLSQPHLDVYHWDGSLMARPLGGKGYMGCHAVFTFRLGEGWVTMSTLPLLQHFQDVRARIELMNLIAAAGSLPRHKRNLPSSPGLLWVMNHRGPQMAAAAAAPDTQAAVFYRPAPGAVEPAAQLVPLGGTQCWSAPAGVASGSAGATLMLDSASPIAASQLDLDFGADATRQPTAYQLEATSDLHAWTALSSDGLNAQGRLSVALPGGALWRQFRVRILAAPPAWRVCGFTAH